MLLAWRIWEIKSFVLLLLEFQSSHSAMTLIQSTVKNNNNNNKKNPAENMEPLIVNKKET